MKKILIITLLFINAARSSGQIRTSQNDQKTIVLTTYRYAQNNRLSNILPLALLLEKQTGYKVKTESYATIFEFIDAIKRKEVDIALINTFGYMLLEQSHQANIMETSVALKVYPDAKDNYKTAVVVPSDSKITSFNSLEKAAPGFNLKLVSEGSTSGNLVPRLSLSKIGLNEPEKSFKSVSYGGTHRLTIEAVATVKLTSLLWEVRNTSHS
jgi:phosphonate transport system substrate-binding protein